MSNDSSGGGGCSMGRPVHVETDVDSVASEPTPRERVSSPVTHFRGLNPKTKGNDDVKAASKPFLVAGQGWNRYLASLKEGRRYVPKGGHVVDFSALDEKQSKQVKSGESIQKSKTVMPCQETKQVKQAKQAKQGPRPSVYCHSAYSYKTDRSALNDMNDDNTMSKDNGSRPDTSWQLGLELKPEQALFSSPQSSTPGRRPPSAVIRPATATAPSTSTRPPKWKPAGTTGQGSFLAPLVGRRSVNLNRLKTPEAKDSVTEKLSNRISRYKCQDCKSLQKARDEFAQHRTSIRQERTALIQMRRRIESDQSKFTKEKQEFENYKNSELDRLHSTASRLCWRLHRDAMAFEARQRDSMAKVQTNNENQAQEEKEHGQEMERMLSQLEAERHDFKLRERQFEQKISDLEGQLNAIRLNSSRSTPQSDQDHLSLIPFASEEQSTPRHHSLRSPFSPWLLPGELQQGNTFDSPNVSTDCSDMNSLSSSPRTAQSRQVQAAPSPAVSSTGSSTEDTEASVPLQELSPKSPKVVAPTVKCFDNGTICKQWLDGYSLTTYVNGDLKQTFPSGITEYYYASAQIWQVSHPSNIEVYYFPNGRVEAHHPDGLKEVLLPTEAFGAFKVVGQVEEPVIPSTLCAEILFPRPQPLNKT